VGQNPVANPSPSWVWAGLGWNCFTNVNTSQFLTQPTKNPAHPGWTRG